MPELMPRPQDDVTNAADPDGCKCRADGFSPEEVEREGCRCQERAAGALPAQSRIIFPATSLSEAAKAAKAARERRRLPAPRRVEAPGPDTARARGAWFRSLVGDSLLFVLLLAVLALMLVGLLPAVFVGFLLLLLGAAPFFILALGILATTAADSRGPGIAARR